jgi:hypothetical protein
MFSKQIVTGIISFLVIVTLAGILHVKKEKFFAAERTFIDEEAEFNKKIREKRRMLYEEKANRRWVEWNCLISQWPEGLLLFDISMSYNLIRLKGVFENERDLIYWKPICSFESFDIVKIQDDRFQIDIEY